ncbi:hypothetical protein A3H90_00880 [Candidatus Peribacteria bacterium RIFCSPLOWO2_02_FULL_55_36]|nr:MAG: hypothetical protein A2947_00230 [Candidatus Peribacteria bacterium RIFCSPLOWO2_01_FULL_54_110]OGJ69926.1 MAG: hypothetical protein A3H90_00880 [Candidatus Peribacteria bacterium RIFCSPLOWO2_02_FULL_55_36]
MRDKAWDFLEVFDERHTIKLVAQRFKIWARVEATCAENGLCPCGFRCQGIMAEISDHQRLLSTYPVFFHEFSENLCLVACVPDNACEEVCEVVVQQFFLEDVLWAAADQVLFLHNLRRFLECMSCVRKEIWLVASFFYSTPKNTIQIVIGDVRRDTVPLVELHVIVDNLTAIDLKRVAGESEVSENPPHAFVDVRCIVLERSVPVPDDETNFSHDRRS